MVKAFSIAWLECGLYNNLITDFFQECLQHCLSVNCANKNVVVGVIFATNAFLGYVGNG